MIASGLAVSTLQKYVSKTRTIFNLAARMDVSGGKCTICGRWDTMSRSASIKVKNKTLPTMRMVNEMRFNFDKTNYEEAYATIKNGMKPVADFVAEMLTKKCQENVFIKWGGLEFEPHGFCTESDYPYTFHEVTDIEILECFFDHGNWSVRDGIVYAGLAFINQVNGGDEWWTLKYDGRAWISFESITFKGMIKDGRFHDYINTLVAATPEECRERRY